MFRALRIVAFCLVFLNLPHITFADGCWDYRQSFHSGAEWNVSDPVGGLAADGDLALVATGDRVRFLDLTNPDNPVARGEYDLGSHANLAASAERLAVLATENELILLNWADPESAHLVGSLPLPEGTESIFRQGDQLLVARGTHGVDLFSCSTGAGFVFLGNYDSPGTAHDACLMAGWMMVADGDALLTVDISQPATPVLVQSYAEYYLSAEDVAVARVLPVDEKLLVSSVRWVGGYGGEPTPVLDLMTLATSGQATLEGYQYFYGSDWPGYDAAAGYLFVATDDGIQVLDLNHFPDVVARDGAAIGQGPVLLVGDTLLAQETANAFQNFDARYPAFAAAEPSWAGSDFHDISGGQARQGFVLKDQRTWSGYSFSYSAWLYDVWDPQNVVELHQITDNGYSGDVFESNLLAADGERALLEYYTSYGSACFLVDLRSGETQVTTLPYGGGAILVGNRVFQRTGDWDSLEGVAILDASVPGAVSELGFLEGNSYFPPYGLSEDMVILMGAELQVWDIADPTEPLLLGSVPGCSGTVLGRQGDRLFLKKNSRDFCCVDVSNPGVPVLVWEQELFVQSLAIQGNVAAIVHYRDAEWSMRAYDLVADPLGPVPLGTAEIQLGNDVEEILWEGTTLYTDKLEVFNFGDPSHPEFLGRAFGGGRGLFRQDFQIVTATGCFPVQCAASPVLDDQELQPLRPDLALRAAPNPFNPRTSIRFVLPQAETVHLVIHDLAGRKVKTIYEGRLPAGEQTFRWDGLDEAGRAQASGVYFVHLSAGSLDSTGKMVLLR